MFAHAQALLLAEALLRGTTAPTEREAVLHCSGKTAAFEMTTPKEKRTGVKPVRFVKLSGALMAARPLPGGKLRRCGPGLSGRGPCGRCLRGPGLRAGRSEPSGSRDPSRPGCAVTATVRTGW